MGCADLFFFHSVSFFWHMVLEGAATTPLRVLARASNRARAAGREQNAIGSTEGL